MKIKLNDKVTIKKETYLKTGNFRIYFTSSDVFDRRGTRLTDATGILSVRLPYTCPACGVSLDDDKVIWSGPITAECRCCGTKIKGGIKRIE